ncbi:mechanosensitive ion channel domain-containing protein [Roseivirga sp. E12]|uniref:mechanosensitive ion channel domain-containing protein n=1 Tax=Roseivirga sp. E12 TaxID=2819237 RepID=UPI001ABC98C6|nr:mechanosensitive ion channel domain-containing protein [Roseivirga sp. E12]MBO3699925.1 mechanosensitive ion channel [Roseivirga sp. E12]
MEYEKILESIELWFSTHVLSMLISLGIVILYLISRKVIKSLVKKHGTKHDFDKSRMLYISKITGLGNSIVFGALLGFTWEISLSGLSFYFASIFTVVGVALFAHWSILSNLTASVILFFFFPYRIGSHIKIQDGDNSIEGLILDIKMFYIEIELEDGRIASYPNNLAIQKASIQKK